MSRSIDDEFDWESREYSTTELVDGFPCLDVVNYDYETGYRKHLIEYLRHFGWDVTTEVTDVNHNGQVDIVAEHPSVGCIAFEVKRTPGNQGGPLGEGIAQLLNYRSYTYEDFDIDFWVLAPGFDVYTEGGETRMWGNRRMRMNLIIILAELQLGLFPRSWRRIVFGKWGVESIRLRDPKRLGQSVRQPIAESLRDRTLNTGEYEPEE